MIPTLKAEFKKLLTVRSTFVLVLFAVFLTGLITYLSTAPLVYEEVKVAEAPVEQPVGSQQQLPEERPPRPEEIITTVSHDLPKERLVSHLQDSLPVLAILIAIVVVLLMAHEFRYNTINYTLTASNSRSKVLISKIIVCIIFVTLATLLVMAATTAATYAAVNIKHLNLPPQDYNWGYIVARLLGYSLGFSLMGLAIITLVRNQIFGIVSLLILPMIDNIAAAIMAARNIEATKVLPFSALGRVENVLIDLVPSDNAAEFRFNPELLPATVLGAAAVFAVYLLGLWIIAWISFLKRDAN